MAKGKIDGKLKDYDGTYIYSSKRRISFKSNSNLFPQDASGNFIFRYLFVQLDDFPRNVIVLEDNRHTDAALTSLSDSLSVEALQ